MRADLNRVARARPFPTHRILTRDMVDSRSGARGSDLSARSPPPQPPPPNAVLTAAGVEPHPEPRPTSAFGANEVYDVLGSDDDAALKAEVEAATAALRADLKATSDRLAELETGAGLQELDGMQGELAKKIRAWREEMYGGTMEALSELEALKLAIEKRGSLNTDVARMVEELAATKLEATNARSTPTPAHRPRAHPRPRPVPRSTLRPRAARTHAPARTCTHAHMHL